MVLLLIIAAYFQDPCARLSGRIVDAQSGADLRGLVNLVRLSNKVPDDDITVLSKRNGWYEAGIVSPGEYRAVAVVDGYRPSIKNITVKSRASVMHLNFRMRVGHQLTLMVHDQKGIPVEEAWATITYKGEDSTSEMEWTYLQIYNGSDTARSKRGRLFWEGLPPGEWEIRINRPGYIPVTITTEKEEASVILRKGRLVYLTIENQDGSRAPDIFVSIHSKGESIFSGITGAYGDVAVTMRKGRNDLFLYRLPLGRERTHKKIQLGEEERVTIRWGLP